MQAGPDIHVNNNKKKNKVILKQFSQARGWLERKRKERKN
jgi:hypothetical protein